MKDTTIFYHEWLPLINSLPNEKRLKFYDLIFSINKNCEQNEHVLNLFKEQKINVDFSDNHFMSIFNFVCQKILENNKKYKDEIGKRKFAGIMSGKARRKEGTHVQSVEQERTHVQSVEQEGTKRTDNVNDNDIIKKDNTSVLSKEKPTLKLKTIPKFKKLEIPTLEQVKAYASEAKLLCNYEKFFDHFTANGWKQSNKNPIVDWKAALRNWDRNESKFASPDEIKTKQEASQALNPREESEIGKIHKKIIEEQGIKGYEVDSFKKRFSIMEKREDGLYVIAKHPIEIEVFRNNYRKILNQYSIKVEARFEEVDSRKSLIN